MSGNAACPRCGDPGYADINGHRHCGNAACEYTDDLPTSNTAAMTDTVYCLGCGQAFPTDGLTSEDHGYPLSSGMCQACVTEGRRRPWQIVAENQRLRDTIRWYVAEREAQQQGRATAAFPEAWEALRHAVRYAAKAD